MNWSSLSAAFLSAGIEFFEIAAIAYAISRAGYAREALSGTTAGLALVAVVSFYAWRGLERVPLHLLQGSIGLLLCLVGSWWIIKAVRKIRRHQRSQWIADPLADESFELKLKRFSILNCLLMAKSAATEGFEIAVVVVALGVASHAWFAVALGTAAAFAVTIGLVVALHGRLRQIPENSIKLGTGIVLFIVGAFWIAESGFLS